MWDDQRIDPSGREIQHVLLKLDLQTNLPWFDLCIKYQKQFNIKSIDSSYTRENKIFIDKVYKNNLTKGGIDLMRVT